MIADSRVRANVETSWIRDVRTGNEVVDPQFVDAAKNDYRLRSGSPCAWLGPARHPVG